MVNIEVK